MARVGSRGGEGVPQLAHRAGGVQALLPGLARVRHEALEAVHRRLAVLRPQPTRSAKWRDAALDGQAGARERDDVARPGEAARRRLERLKPFAIHAAVPSLIPPAPRVNG